VDYAGAMLGGREGFHVTLLHVISEPEEDYFPKIEEKQQWLEQYRRRITAVLEDYRRRLVDAGVSEGGIPGSHPPAVLPLHRRVHFGRT
jgi:hypothetical protein